MPLIHSASKDAFKANVSEMVKAGHPLKQALAASYNVQRHVSKDEHEERQIERAAHEKLKYGKEY